MTCKHDPHVPKRANHEQGARFHAADARFALPVRLYWTAGAKFRFSLNRHPEIEIQYIQCGHGDYFIEHMRYPFEPNSLLIIRPNELHRGNIKAGVYMDSACLVFSRSLLKGMVPPTTVARLPRSVRLTETEGAEVNILLRLITQEIQNRMDGWRDNVIRILGILIVMAGRWSGRSNPAPAPNPLVEHVVAYINEHFAAPITLGNLTAQFHISPTGLSRVFSRATGKGIKQYVIERRIAEVKRLLLAAHAPKIEWISQTVGFRRYWQLNRHFKRLTGMIPSQYRLLLRPRR